MKKYLLLLALVCLLGNRALAQTKSSYSKTVTEEMDFTGFNRSWTGDNPSSINWTDRINYISGITQNGEKRSFVSKLDKIYYLSVGQGNKEKWQISHINNGDASTSYLENSAAGTDFYIHGIKIGDKVKIKLKGSCTMASNNTDINQGTTLSGEVEFHMVDNTIINNEGIIKLNFPNQYAGIQKIEITTTVPYFNYDPGYEVYDFFQIGAGKNNAYTNCSANVAAGFKLNGNDAYYLSLPGTDISLNDRIAVSPKTGWSVARGIRAPGYSDGNSQWYNVSICNLYAGDRVEVFYTGDAPTFSSNGQNGGYNGSNAFKDVKNDGEYNSDEGDQLIYAGMSLEGENSRNEGQLSGDEGTTVLLYKSFAYVMTENGHLDLGLKNGNHTRIVKVKIYSDHQARMVDKSEDNYRSATAYFDITGELQAKEHIMPGGLEVRVGNEDKTQHAIVVASRRGPVSYVNAVDGFKLPGITKNSNGIQIKFNLNEEVPTTGTFYKFIALNSGKLKVRFNAASVNYYRYDLTGDAVYYDEGIGSHSPWLALYDRANEQTLDKDCPYYVMESTDNGATSTGAAAVWGGGSSSGSGGGGGNDGDITLTTPSGSQTLSISEILNNTSNTNDIVTFYFNTTNYYSGLDIGYLVSSNNNTQYRFDTSNVTGNGDFQLTYTVQELINIAGSQNGGIKANVYNATLNRVALASSSSSGSGSSSGTNASTSSSKLYGNGADGEFEIDVEAGKTYFFYGGWSGTNYVISPHDDSTNGKDACGVAELLDVTFTPDRDIHPLAKWVPSETKDDDDLADVIGYSTADLTIKKMSGSITGCTPEIKEVNGKLKLTIKDITFKDGENPGGVILIKVGRPTEKDDPVYAFTVAYDANYHSTSDVAEPLRGHTWDFSSTSLQGLEWDGTPKNAVETDYGTYFKNYFASGENSGVNGSIVNGVPQGSLLYKEMNYTVDNVPRSDWMFNYRMQSGSNNYDPRFLNKYDIEGDNADMIWTTEGLIIKASPNQSCMFNEFGNGNIHSSTKDPDRYVGILSGGEFIIPHLNANDRVIIYMGSGTNAGVEPEDMKFHITNARDAVYKEISEEDVYLAGGSLWNSDNSDNNYRGCYHFFAQADGDMKFTLEGSNSICKLYKIQIYHGDRINTNEIKGATENDKFLLWSRDNDPNDNTGKEIGPTYNWTLNYFGKDQKLADGTDGVKNGIVELQATKIKSGVNINDNGFTTSNVTDPTQPLYNTFTYQHDYGQIGTFRMRGKDMEKNMKYVADYGDHNVTVAYQETQTYPYTWDFMDMIGYSVSHFSNEDAIGIGSSITTNKPTWFVSDDDWNLSYEKSSTDLSLWEKLSGNNPAYDLRLNSQKEQGDGDLKEKDNIFETAKDIPLGGGNQVWANGAVVPETQGLWFYSYNNNQNNGKWSINSDGMDFGGTSKDVLKVVVPNVPANAAVYLRMVKNREVGPDYAYEFMGGNTNLETYGPIQVDGTNEYILAIMNKGTAKRHLTLSIAGYRLKKLAVSTDPKKIGSTGYATESRAEGIGIDHNLTAYLTGKDIKAYTGALSADNTQLVMTQFGATETSAKILPAATNGDNNGCILHHSDGAVSILNGGFHVFVPDMHDKINSDRMVSTTTNVMKSFLPGTTDASTKGFLGATAGDNTNLVLTAKKYSYGTDGSTVQSGTEVNFVRVDPKGNNNQGASLSYCSAYLQLPTNVMVPLSGSSNGSNAKLSIVFVDELFGEVSQGIATGIVDLSPATGNNPAVMEAEWYNLSGQKLNGQPTEKGMYIVNGKKVLVK